MTLEDARRKVLQHFKTYYSIESLDEVTILGSPGYWERRTPCGGRGICNQPVHNFLGCEGGIHHTVYYSEYGVRDSHGRFVSPFRVWKMLKETADEKF